MTGKWRFAVAVVVGAMLAAGLVACGGSSSGSSSSGASSSSSSQSQSTASTTPTTSTSTSESPQSVPSSEFVGGGPNGKLAAVGKEAEAAEREAASRVLEESFKAREAKDWAGQCSTLMASLVAQIEKGAAVLAGGGGCAKALELQAAKATPAALANTMTGPIDVLRISGNRGFAFYHGTKGKDYVMALFKEGGKWKVGSLVTQEAP